MTKESSTLNKTQAESAAEELLKNGSVTLTAKTRQDIYDQSTTLVNSLPEGTKWSRTICTYHPDTFSYEQKITIIK